MYIWLKLTTHEETPTVSLNAGALVANKGGDSDGKLFLFTTLGVAVRIALRKSMLSD